jgi:hypothetical protein
MADDAQPDSPVVEKPRRKRKRKSNYVKKGYRIFTPSEDQKFVVSQLCGVMNWDNLRLLIRNPHTGKAISKETLQKAFPEELATGKALLQQAVFSSFVELPKSDTKFHAKWSATEWGLQYLCGFRSDNPSAQLSLEDRNGRKMTIDFVVPSQNGHNKRLSMEELQHAEGRNSAQTDLPISRATPPEPSPRRIAPSEDDLVLDRVQPSAFVRKRGGFSWMD